MASLFVTLDLSDEQGLSLIPEIPNDAGDLKLNYKKNAKKHKAQWMKRPMALTDLLLEFQDADLRENAMRCLSNYVIQKKDESMEFYENTGFFLYNSCGTAAILLQEIICMYPELESGDLSLRKSKRLANVLTLFQCIAANKETRGSFIKARLADYVIPYILSNRTEDPYENIRALSLSIIAIVCQHHEEYSIQWAVDAGILPVCLHALEIGNEVSKVMAMYIMEAIFHNKITLTSISDYQLDKVLHAFADVVAVLAVVTEFSPRLLYHVVRCYMLLCQDERALSFLRENIPKKLLDKTFHTLMKKYKILQEVHHQLLLCTGKRQPEESPIVLQEKHLNRPAVATYASPPTAKIQFQGDKENVTPLRPVNLHKENWSSETRKNIHQNILRNIPDKIPQKIPRLTAEQVAALIQGL